MTTEPHTPKTDPPQVMDETWLDDVLQDFLDEVDFVTEYPEKAEGEDWFNHPQKEAKAAILAQMELTRLRGYEQAVTDMQPHLTQAKQAAVDTALGKRLDEDDVTDLKCSVCWRAPSRLYMGRFYCGTHFQKLLQQQAGKPHNLTKGK